MIIPYAVGVDIGCSMACSIFSVPASILDDTHIIEELTHILKANTAFGVGAHFVGHSPNAAVLDSSLWGKYTNPYKKMAVEQLGSSGSGNHFVSIGSITTDGIPELNVPQGNYLTMISHSGSRGLGNKIANDFTRLAMKLCPLPDEAKHLAWLDIDTEDGRDYWDAMNLAMEYSVANHTTIHDSITKATGFDRLAFLHNMHNFARQETHFGKKMMIHRKGATPAGDGELGIIPGTMADKSYIVRGLGNESSLCSSSHGAGRKLSRKVAKESISKSDLKKLLEERNVILLSAGLDESPQAYKPIADVMEAQKDLVEPIAEYTPRLVIMSGQEK
jgi:tRNA-splicing ligase RtcB